MFCVWQAQPGDPACELSQAGSTTLICNLAVDNHKREMLHHGVALLTQAGTPAPKESRRRGSPSDDLLDHAVADQA